MAEANEVRDNLNISYDKIIKENMPRMIKELVSDVLKLNVTTIEELPAKVQYIKESEADHVSKIKATDGSEYILHLEYQSTNDSVMVYRMAEYSVMFQRKYRLPVIQYVIYIGKRRSTMMDTLNIKDMQFRYNLLSTSDLNYRIFLRSTSIELKLQTVWADLNKAKEKIVLERLVEDIYRQKLNKTQRQKLFDQLHYFAKLRKLEHVLKEVMITVKLTQKQIENDPFLKEGEKRAMGKVAKRMLLLGRPIAEIIQVTGLNQKEIEKGK